MIESLASTLARDGIVVLPDLLSKDQLSSMRKAFESRLRRMRWNNFDGYERLNRTGILCKMS